jgi:signal peptidase II
VSGAVIRRLLPGLLAAAAVLVLDQGVKAWLLDLLLALGGHSRITSYFNLVMVWNTGVSFGLLRAGEEGRWLLIPLSLGIVAVLLVWLARAETRSLSLALGLVIGGALGNVIDRLRFGAVADFFDFHIAGYHWPAFNVADAAIVLGVAVILLQSLLLSRPTTK